MYIKYTWFVNLCYHILILKFIVDLNLSICHKYLILEKKQLTK